MADNEAQHDTKISSPPEGEYPVMGRSRNHSRASAGSTESGELSLDGFDDSRDEPRPSIGAPVLTVDFEKLRAAQKLVAFGGSPRKAFSSGDDEIVRQSFDDCLEPVDPDDIDVDDEEDDEFVDNVDEYEITALKGHAKKLREKLFQAQQELAKAEELRQRAFRKVFTLRNELIACVSAEGGDTRAVDIEGGSAMVQQTPATPQVLVGGTAAEQAAAAATSLKAAASVASVEFPELSSALASAATVVEDAVGRRLGAASSETSPSPAEPAINSDGAGVSDGDDANAAGEEAEQPKSPKTPKTPAASLTPSDAAKLAEQASSGEGAADAGRRGSTDGSRARRGSTDGGRARRGSTDGSSSRRGSVTDRGRDRDSMSNVDGLNIDALTREIDADSLDTRIFRQGIILFNISARKGIDYMVRPRHCPVGLECCACACVACVLKIVCLLACGE